MNNNMKWIKAGTKLFAEHGNNGLKVELIAREVGISKSSFYHYFADMEIFVDRMLDHHINQYKIIAEKESQCKRLDPEIFRILIEFKNDLLFNRQLRVNRNDSRFAICLEKVNSIVGPTFMQVWKSDLNLTLPSSLLEKLFPFVREAFYLRIDKDVLNEEWLPNYFSSVKDTLIGLASSAKTA